MRRLILAVGLLAAVASLFIRHKTPELARKVDSAARLQERSTTDRRFPFEPAVGRGCRGVGRGCRRVGRGCRRVGRGLQRVGRGRVGGRAVRRAEDGRGARSVASLDDVEGVGHFAEIEIQAPEEQLAAARDVLLWTAAELGLSGSERRSYLEMLLASREE